LNEQQRVELFEMWKRGAPFPEIASAVSTFMQDAAARAVSLEGELTPLAKPQGTLTPFSAAGDGDPGFALDEAKSISSSFSFWTGRQRKWL